nr:translocation/assembly module TamB domain-containing protein [uncultured Methylotenera sp.]
MARSYLYLLLLSISLLLFTPAHSEMPISVSSSLDSFSHDLDNIHLKLEKLSARWQLSPFGDGKLVVEQLKAKRLIITIKSSNDESESSPLPKRIHLPLPISVLQSEISEVVIITQDERQTLYNVKLSFKGNANSLKLNLAHATTPWGNASAHINMSAAKPFALKGELSLKNAESPYPYDLNAQLSGDLNTLNIDSTAWLASQNGKISLLKSGSEQAAAQLLVHSQIELNHDYAVRVNSQLLALQPERLGNYPAAKLNLDLTLEGALKPSPNARLKLSSHDSTWQTQAVSASANAQLSTSALEQLTFELSVAANRIKGAGNINAQNTHLEWQAELPELTAFAPALAGKVSANGTIDGALDNPSLSMQLLGEKLQMADSLRINELTGNATMIAGDNGTITAKFAANAVQYGNNVPLNGNLTLDGTQANHMISISADSPDAKLQSTLKGGLALNAPTPNVSTAEKQWQGVLQQLDYSGLTSVKLKAPAKLNANIDGIALTQANLLLNHGNIDIEYLTLNKGKLTSQGKLAGLSLNDLPPGLLTLPNTLQGSPSFSGEWRIATQETINARFNLQRDSGDFTLRKPDGSTQPLGLSTATLELNVVDNALRIAADLDGKNIGTISAKLASQLTKTEAGFSLLNNAPLQLSANAKLNTLAWLPMPTSLMDADLDGQIALTVSADGTLAQPNLSGTVNGNNINFNLPSEGIQLSKGTFQAHFENNQLQIEQAIWQGGTGSLNANGWLFFDQGQPKAELNWSANQFSILSRTDRLLVISGNGKTSLADNLLSISGDFTVDKGLIEMAQEDTPTLSDDVIILGANTSKKEPLLQTLLNGFHIQLGDDFTLRGRGLDAKLTGELTLTGRTEYRPHTKGSIAVSKGTFMAYGQILNIERGILNFNGVMDNPGLNIRAMRDSKPVNAGVEITGSALVPEIKLVSDPNVPDTDKLAWLVLGHGTEQAGKSDFAILSLAAGALFSQGQSVPLQSQIARAAGLDEFSFAGGDAENASVTLGKRLSSQLYLSYAKSVSGLQDIARLTFNITPRWALRAEAGNESAVDVLYTFSFK